MTHFFSYFPWGLAAAFQKAALLPWLSLHMATWQRRTKPWVVWAVQFLCVDYYLMQGEDVSRTLVYFSLASHFFVLITTPPSSWKTAVPELDGKTHGCSRSRFIDVFHSPGCSLRSSRHSKVEEKKKKRHAPESISFHIPSSCDVEEPKMSAKKSEELSFGGLGWDFFLLKKKKEKQIEKTTTKTPRRISAPGCQRHNAFCPTSCVDVSFWNILVNIQPGTAAVNTNTLFAILCK